AIARRTTSVGGSPFWTSPSGLECGTIACAGSSPRAAAGPAPSPRANEDPVGESTAIMSATPTSPTDVMRHFRGWQWRILPAARLMTHWFAPRELATKMSLWNTSHSIGAALVAVLCGYLVTYGGWRLCFHVPAAIALAGAVFLALSLRDTPQSLGFPPVEGT